MKTTTNHPALYWEARDRGRAKCVLCPIECVLAEGKIGVCKGKQNIDGALVAINYGRTCALAVDPIEKKPLYNFHPGSQILSIGPNGCNLACNFCQNYHISQKISATSMMTSEQVVKTALEHRSVGIAYTYTEPLIWFEYVLDTAKLAREAGLVNVLVTNGQINPEPLEELLPFVDALNVDIKSMDEKFYKIVCKGKLAPVLATVEQAAKSAHVEITNLVIPGMNDSDEMFLKLTDFIAGIDPLIPIHFSRYHPDYEQTAPPTPYETLNRAAEIASEKLKYVYIGNVAADEGNQTFCPHCGEVVIRRSGYTVKEIKLDRGKCRHCGYNARVVM